MKGENVAYRVVAVQFYVQHEITALQQFQYSRI